MKRFFIFLFIALVFYSCGQESMIKLQEIDDVCSMMDDIYFMKYCYEFFDVNHDGKVSMTEANAVKSIDLGFFPGYDTFRSLKGIEYFSQLIELDCTGPDFVELSSLDVSHNSQLRVLKCAFNELTSLDVSKNKNLEVLDCCYNSLTSLDVSNNSQLKVLLCNPQWGGYKITPIGWESKDPNEYSIVEPEPEPEPEWVEYVAPILIDGDFSDWAKLDPSKIASATCDKDATKTALKLVKVFADAVYVFVYFEWDRDQITHEPDVEHVPFHCYINTDGDAKTGGYGDQFSDACMDVMFEGVIYPDGAAVGSYEPGVYKWIGETNGTGWAWKDLGEFNNLTAGAGIEGKYEFQISRELMPMKLADTFYIGFDIQQRWNSVGILPNSHVTDDNPRGLAPSLQVKTVK